jgi:N-acetylglucosamine-6-phosphate deacetylase
METKGYLDLQVNGYGGIDFNQDDLSPDQLHLACRKLRDDGVSGVLATVITDHLEVMASRLARLVELRERDGLAKELILGIHIEGPFINDTPGYAGAHPRDAIRPACQDTIKRLLDAAGGLTRLVTLAPECDENSEVTRLLVKQNVLVSAGHTNASLDQLAAAADAGLSMFTHLGNGCPAELPRHDNIIQRALALPQRLWLCFIADGVHIPYFVLKNYLAIAGLDRCIVVTDAMAAAGMPPGRYTIGRWDLAVGEDLAVRSPDGSHLVGSAMTMRQAEANLKEHVGLRDDAVARLLMINPRATQRNTFAPHGDTFSS